ncbi:MAG: 4Fe-4S dicluster domain-containing protein [Deltaproteobacteria bacterium]|nr:4Fe-4S dicluster domain-containing protein [Deltaproteobacteria bacterium]
MNDPPERSVVAPPPSPGGADDDGMLTRRAFLERSAAALAAAGLAGCPSGDPPERILPYARMPEHIVPGRPLFYATAVATTGAIASPLVVETHEGRPTRVDGHPEHPATRGASDAFAQALVRDLYDPGRSSGVRRGGAASSWSAFYGAAAAALAAGDGAVALLAPPTTSRTLADAIARFTARFPRARWYGWAPVPEEPAAGGAALDPSLAAARAVLTLDDDLLAWSPGRLRHARELAARRAAHLAPGDALRLWAVESFPTITGAMADHRRVARVDAVPALAEAVVTGLAGGAVAEPGLAAAVADLRAAGPAGLVTAGPQQPAVVHALARRANALLGAVGKTARYAPPAAFAAPGGGRAELVAAIGRGEVGAVLVLGGNPVYDGPADLDVAGALARVPFTAHLALRVDETGLACDWHLPLAHPLEAWGDARAEDGSTVIAQPTITPLYGGQTAAEVLTALSGDVARGRDLVERALGAAGVAPGGWDAVIEAGVVRPPAGLVPPPPAEAAAPGRAPRPLAAPLVLAFRPDPTAWDGRFGHHPWLLELPRPITRQVWGNAAFLSPETAVAHGLAHGDLVAIARGARRVEAVVYVLPGVPDGQVTLHLGLGRRSGGAGAGIGADAYALRTTDALWVASDVTLTPTGERGRPILTQAHTELGEVPPAREATRRAVAERGRAAFFPEGPPHAPDEPQPTLYEERPRRSPSWGMSIDLNACVGCNACVVACQSENNVFTVGPEEAARGRTMHWLRVDTYRADDGRWRFQPVPCMQCEHAPCEVVCPTGATQHATDGLNDMVYNRCVGTRYCSNNCPYKVRRFNFFRYEDPAAVVALGRNPDVTVRTRGVMEKCTYCVQRIRAGSRVRPGQDTPVADGAVKTACQVACPADAIVFGDLADPDAAVTRSRADARSYALLHELGTRPRTTYLGRLAHPSEALPAGDEEPT